MHPNTQILDDSQRAMANSDLRLREALVIGNYAGQVHNLATTLCVAKPLDGNSYHPHT